MTRVTSTNDSKRRTGRGRDRSVGARGSPRNPGPAWTSAAVWAVTLSACGAALAAVYPWGAVQPGDMPILFLAIASGVSLAWLAARGLRGAPGRTVRIWRPVLAGAVLLGGLAASAAFSDQRWTGLLGAPGSSMGLVGIAMLLTIGLFAANARSAVRAALERVAPWMLLLECLTVAMQLTRVDSPGGTTSNSTFLSQVLLVLLPATLMPALASGTPMSRVSRAARIGLAGAALLVLVLSGSRVGTVLGVAVIAACAAVSRRAPRPGRTPRARWLAAAVAGAAVAFAAPVAVVLAADPLRFEGPLASRPYMWEAALRVWSGSPVLGVGPDAFRIAIAPHASGRMSVIEGGAQSTFGTLAADPHNALVALLAAGGVLGLALFGWLTYEVFRNWAAQSAAGRMDAGAVIGVAAYTATTILAPAPLQTALLAALVLGISLLPERAPAAAASAAAHLRPLASRAGLALGAAACLLLAAHAVTRVAVGPIEVGTVSPADAIRAQRAADAWRVDPFLHFWAARMWMFVGLEQGLPAAGEDARRAAARAVELEPRNPFYVREHALALALFDGDEAPTVALYRRSVELFPNWAEVRIEFADYLLERGRKDEAVEQALAGVELVPDSADAHDSAASALESVGERSEAEAHRREALRLRAREASR